MQNSLKQFLSMRDDCVFCNTNLVKRLASLQTELQLFKSLTISEKDNIIDFPLEIANTDLILKINLETQKMQIEYATAKIDRYNLMWSVNNCYSFFQLLCSKCDYAISSDFISVDVDLNIDSVDIYSETFILENKMIINDYTTNHTSITKFHSSVGEIASEAFDYPLNDNTIKINKIDFNIFKGLNKQQIKSKLDVIINFQ